MMRMQMEKSLKTCHNPETSDEESEDGFGMDIVEEYHLWRKNCSLIYDFALTHALKHPSLTLEWRKYLKEQKEDGYGYTEQELLLGTCSNASTQNYLILKGVKIPNEDDLHEENGLKKKKKRKKIVFNDERDELGPYANLGQKVRVKLCMNHDGKVVCARSMPQDENFIASLNHEGKVNIFSVREHKNINPQKEGDPAKPFTRCNGPRNDGSALHWSPSFAGYVASSSDDGCVSLWDVGGGGSGSEGVDPLIHLKEENYGGFEDLQFQSQSNLLGVISNSGHVRMWDIRAPPQDRAKFGLKAYKSEGRSLSYSPFNSHLLATSGSDTDPTVKVWDLRRFDAQPIAENRGHTDNINGVHWSPFSSAILASCGEDRRVMIWDMSLIGKDQTTEELQDGCPELIFIHGGHTSNVTDLCWNPHSHWMISSVSLDSIVQVWSPSERIYGRER